MGLPDFKLAGVFGAFVLVFAVIVHAQAPSPLEFDAAVVKQSGPTNVEGSTYQFLPGAGLRITNGTLKGMLETAYDLRDFQVSGGPGWVNTECYDVLAKSPVVGVRSDHNSPEDIKDIRSSLQLLLTAQFHLQVHREMKDSSEYALVIAKKGAKLPAVAAPSGPKGIQATCGQMIGTAATMANLILPSRLSGAVGSVLLQGRALCSRDARG